MYKTLLDKAGPQRACIPTPPWRSSSKAADLDEQLGISVSSETVRRHLKQRLGRRLRPVKKPHLSSHHMQAILAFAIEWARRAWAKVVVTDSKYFWLCPSGVGRKVWVRYRRQPNPGMQGDLGQPIRVTMDFLAGQCKSPHSHEHQSLAGKPNLSH